MAETLSTDSEDPAETIVKGKTAGELYTGSRIRHLSPAIPAAVCLLAVFGTLGALWLKGGSSQSVVPQETSEEEGPMAATSSAAVLPGTLTVYYDGTNEMEPGTYDPDTFHAEDDLTESWELEDPDRIRQIGNWLESVQGSKDPDSAFVGNELPVDRYEFCWAGESVKVNFYDDAVLIVGDRYYRCTQQEIDELVSLISSHVTVVRVFTGDGRSWKITDQDDIGFLIHGIAKIESEYDPVTRGDGILKGGNQPNIIKYTFNGTPYTVYFNPEGKLSNICICHSSIASEKKEYLADKETVRRLYSIVIGSG